MLKRILISSDGKKIIRTAFTEGKLLNNFDIEVIGKEGTRYNIYKGYVTRIEVSLSAVFVDYGENKQGFLPFREISSYYYKHNNTIFKNDVVLVQIIKEERDGKGALLTTFISLVGNYLILMPNNSVGGGISRKLSVSTRDDIKSILSKISIPKGMSVIVRTASLDRNLEDIEWDFNILLAKWNAVQYVSRMCLKPFLIYESSCFYSRLLYDCTHFDFFEIIIDNLLIFEGVTKFFEVTRPSFIKYIKLYSELVPLFTRYKIDKQINRIFMNTVCLPSGGEIRIDCTEALVSIDVNSAKAVSNSNIEETAFLNNIEAAREIGKQLRVRDLGGIIVIDFIDMLSVKNKSLIEKSFLLELHKDKAKIKVGTISKFGLLELSRQRLRRSINIFSESLCAYCCGRGTTLTVEMMSAIVLQAVYEESCLINLSSLTVVLSYEVFIFLTNSNRADITNIEKIYNIKIFLICRQDLRTEQYKVTRQYTKRHIENRLLNAKIAKTKVKSAIFTFNKKKNNEYTNYLKSTVYIYDSFIQYVLTSKLYTKLNNKLKFFLRK